MTMLFSRIKATDIVQAVQTELLQSTDELLHAAEPRPAPAPLHLHRPLVQQQLQLDLGPAAQPHHRQVGGLSTNQRRPPPPGGREVVQ